MISSLRQFYTHPIKRVWWAWLRRLRRLPIQASARSIRIALLSARKDAADNKRFDEAERLVSKVEGREQRAYLRTEIAKGLLNASETQTHARELLKRQ